MESLNMKEYPTTVERNQQEDWSQKNTNQKKEHQKDLSKPFDNVLLNVLENAGEGGAPL